MRTVVLALENVPSIGTTGLHDALKKADRSWRLVEPESTPLFDLEFVGLTSEHVHCADGVWIEPTTCAESVAAPDLVAVPGLDDDLDRSFAANAGWVPWLRDWARSGAVIAASCTGAFLVAEAGLLDAKPATTHWVAARQFAQRYPACDLDPSDVIVDTGSVITSGGATSFLNLVVHLVARFAGTEHATHAAKLLLIDGDRSSQLPYTILTTSSQHDDPDVRRVQNLIESDLDGDLDVKRLAAESASSERTLERRFKAALAMTPRDYVQLARVERAKHLLEATGASVESIRAQVGYRDATAFRRLFKRHVGLTPRDYRLKFRGGPAHLRA